MRRALCLLVWIASTSVLLADSGAPRAPRAGRDEADPRFFALRCSVGCDAPRHLPGRLLVETADLVRSADNRLTLGVGLGFALLAVPADDDVRHAVAETPSLGRHRDGIFNLGSVGGSRLGAFGTAGALYAMGRWTDRPRLEATGKQAAEALLLTNLFVDGIKTAVDRRRPDGTNRRSFPSGHTANAFALASVLQHNYGWKTGLPAYAFAAFVGYSRINDDKHFLSDVLLGAAFGVAVGRSVALFHRRHVNVAPLVGRRTRGLTVRVDF